MIPRHPNWFNVDHSEGVHYELPSTNMWTLGANWDLTESADLDLSCLLFDHKGQYIEAINFINVRDSMGSIVHTGDAVGDMGASHHDDEEIQLRLNRVPMKVYAIVVVVSCFRGNMTMLEKLKVRLMDVNETPKLSANGLSAPAEVEMCVTQVTATNEMKQNSALAVWKLYRSDPKTKSQWKLHAPLIPGSGQTANKAVPMGQKCLVDIITHIKISDTGPALNTVDNICSMLSPDIIKKLRKHFTNGPTADSIQREKFVEVMTQRLCEASPILLEPDRALKLVYLLHRLFDKIDCDFPYGTAHWDDFTSFCVEVGMAVKTDAIQDNDEEDKMEYRYVEDGINFRNPVARGHRVARLKWIPHLEKLAVVESNTSTLKLVDVEGNFDRIQDCIYLEGIPSKQAVDSLTAGTGKAESANAFAISDCEYMKNRHAMAISGSNRTISVWKQITSSKEVFWSQIAMMETAVTMLKLCWNSISTFLCSVGVDHVIYIWDTMKERCLHRFVRHTSLIYDLIYLPRVGLLVSASFDRHVHLWDTNMLRHKGTLHGHKKGIIQIAHTETILITAGFEYDAFVWDVSSRKRFLKLKGHRHSLCGVQVLPQAEDLDRTASSSGEKEQQGLYAITADITGLFRVWDISKTDSGNGLAPCLQSFCSNSGFLGNIATFCVPMPLAGEANIGPPGFPQIFVGGSRAICFMAKKIEKQAIAPSFVQYNAHSTSIIAMVGSTLKMWDASTGLPSRDYDGICDRGDMHVLAFNKPRENKMIFGSQDGSIDVFALVTGQRMKSMDVHVGKVVSVLPLPDSPLVVTAGTDAQIAVIEELNTELTQLRFVKVAHRKDITCATNSHRLSLIASGSSDGSLHVWDFQTLTLVHKCVGHSCEIVAVNFLDPYPLLLSTDARGDLLIWGVRPCTQQGDNSYLAPLRKLTTRTSMSAVSSLFAGGFSKMAAKGIEKFAAKKKARERRSSIGSDMDHEDHIVSTTIGYQGEQGDGGYIRFIACGLDTGRICVWDIDDVLADLTYDGDLSPHEDICDNEEEEVEAASAEVAEAGAEGDSDAGSTFLTQSETVGEVPNAEAPEESAEESAEGAVTKKQQETKLQVGLVKPLADEQCPLYEDNYNPRLRYQHNFHHTQENAAAQEIRENVTRMPPIKPRHEWRGHNDGVLSVHTVATDEEGPGLMTAGYDYAIRIWNTKGKLLGQIFTSEINGLPKAMALPPSMHFMLPDDPNDNKALAEERKKRKERKAKMDAGQRVEVLNARDKLAKQKSEEKKKKEDKRKKRLEQDAIKVEWMVPVSSSTVQIEGHRDECEQLIKKLTPMLKANEDRRRRQKMQARDRRRAQRKNEIGNQGRIGSARTKNRRDTFGNAVSDAHLMNNGLEGRGRQQHAFDEVVQRAQRRRKDVARGVSAAAARRSSSASHHSLPDVDAPEEREEKEEKEEMSKSLSAKSVDKFQQVTGAADRSLGPDGKVLWGNMHAVQRKRMGFKLQKLESLDTVIDISPSDFLKSKMPPRMLAPIKVQAALAQAERRERPQYQPFACGPVNASTAQKGRMDVLDEDSPTRRHGKGKGHGQGKQRLTDETGLERLSSVEGRHTFSSMPRKKGRIRRLQASQSLGVLQHQANMAAQLEKDRLAREMASKRSKNKLPRSPGRNSPSGGCISPTANGAAPPTSPLAEGTEGEEGAEREDTSLPDIDTGPDVDHHEGDGQGGRMWDPLAFPASTMPPPGQRVCITGAGFDADLALAAATNPGAVVDAGAMAFGLSYGLETSQASGSGDESASEAGASLMGLYGQGSITGAIGAMVVDQAPLARVPPTMVLGTAPSAARASALSQSSRTPQSQSPQRGSGKVKQLRYYPDGSLHQASEYDAELAHLGHPIDGGDSLANFARNAGAEIDVDAEAENEEDLKEPTAAQQALAEAQAEAIRKRKSSMPDAADAALFLSQATVLNDTKEVMGRFTGDPTRTPVLMSMKRTVERFEASIHEEDDGVKIFKQQRKDIFASSVRKDDDKRGKKAAPLPSCVNYLDFQLMKSQGHIDDQTEYHSYLHARKEAMEDRRLKEVQEEKTAVRDRQRNDRRRRNEDMKDKAKSQREARLKIRKEQEGGDNLGGQKADTQFTPFSTPAEVLKVGEMFYKYDTSGEGAIDKQEFLLMIEQLGSQADGRMFLAMDKDGSGEISLGELFELLHRGAPTQMIVNMVEYCTETMAAAERRRQNTMRNKSLTVHQVEELTELFKAMDRDKSGSLGIDELVDVMAADIKYVEPGELKLMLDENDTNGDGVLDLDEFISLMTGGKHRPTHQPRESAIDALDSIPEPAF
jgi:WD40 repeat protein/Ca2+-binding EF-hand superfamily protein/stress response protein SCP2